MDAKLTKSITDLIDETLQELDELRKSRFAASEIKLEGPGDGIAGKPSNGALDAKKAEDDKDEDKDKKKDDDKDMDKGENKSADPGDVHHGIGSDKGAGPREQSGGGKVRGSEGKNSSADPGEIHKADDDKKKDKDEDKDKDKEPHKDDDDHEGKEKKMAQKLLDMHKGEMKKSAEESESLMKSYVEERVKPLEDKLSTILDLVNKIAEQPVAAKGVTARTTPLFKSTEEGGETLSKAVVANKLFELKKSGTKVDSLDIAKVEMGQELQHIIKKYEIS